MSLTPGQQLGSYEIVAAIGAGGMGEVYRARDTRLNRDVALKVLPDAVKADPDRLGRLRREAQLLASLNHQNIAHVYGLEDSPDSVAIVMELVEGPTLADVLQSGKRLPLEETLAIARQIADALEAAHEAGIIHRDLKPANVKVREDGMVKVLDFGLAKALEGERAVALDAALSPVIATMTSPALTAMGVILGTAAYMAPEQAKGKSTDKRVDIWAFGCVLWEMLTGRRLFARESMSETIASVIRDDPPLGELPADVPVSVRRLLERCLERDPRLRLRDIGEARILLATPDAPVPVSRTRAGWRVVIAATVAVCALAAATGVIVWRLAPRNTLPLRQLELPAPIAGASLWTLSPDGSRVAYETNGHLNVRPLTALTTQDLGALPVDVRNLFWSPDGRFVGFTGGSALHTIPAEGGPIFTVCKVPTSGHVLDVQWIGADIVFAVWRDGLYKAPATGGTPTLVLPIDAATEVDFHAFTPMPDERLIVIAHERPTMRWSSNSPTGRSACGSSRTR